MRKWIKGLAGVGAAVALSAAPMAAQVTYFTQGAFGGTAGSTVCINDPVTGAASCTGGGFTLTYTPTANTVTTPTFAQLGSFLLTGSGAVTVPSGPVNFTLNIFQTSPTMGNDSFFGAISGTVTTTSSVLLWSPTELTAHIGPVTYALTNLFEGSVAININRSTSIDAFITQGPTVVPEPGSMALLATGLIGVFGGAIRSRRKARKNVSV